MSKPKPIDSDFSDLIDDDELEFGHQDYERTFGRRAVRQGIEDYFERKKLNDMEDWFGAME